jgi:hypothetical protein
MALSLLQTPALVSLAQSPIIFSVSESTPVYTSSSFQYIGELYYWTGSTTNSGSTSNYTITKYPNTANVGIFDLNRIINSTLTDYAEANKSNVVYYAVDFYFQYQSGSAYLTGSHLKSATYKALDGYGVFQEPIGQNLTSASVHWPLMTSGPATQSVLDNNKGTAGVYVGTAGGVEPTKIVYTSDITSADYTITGNTTTSGQIAQYPIGPLQSGFPLSGSYSYFTVQAFNGATALGTPIKYEVVCNEKYPNVRIKWKNRFGQFDYFNFDMVNKQSFNTTTRDYQPQLGTWTGTSLSYNSADSSNLNYIVDSKQSLVVNTDWIPEAYNDIIKQILVSEEMYWIQNESSAVLTPITIATDSIVFKTGVVDKVIQYSFEFNYGQGYKLIL